MNRRALLCAAVALPVVGAGAATPGLAHPNAALIALCAQGRAQQGHLDAWNADTLDEREGEAANLPWWSLLRAIVAIRTQATAGLREKAEATRIAIQGIVGSDATEMPHLLALSLTADMLGLPHQEIARST